jgi:hypothetical protein
LALNGKPPVLRPGREQDRARRDLMIPSAHDVALVAGLERHRAVLRRQPRVELPGLRDRRGR